MAFNALCGGQTKQKPSIRPLIRGNGGAGNYSPAVNETSSRKEGTVAWCMALIDSYKHLIKPIHLTQNNKNPGNQPGLFFSISGRMLGFCFVQTPTATYAPKARNLPIEA